MKLSISATLTDEQVLILAKEKWWQEKVITFPKNDWVEDILNPVESNNSISANEFIINVYQSMIVEDVTKIFTNYNTQALKEKISQTESLVRSDIESSITSSIE